MLEFDLSYKSTFVEPLSWFNPQAQAQYKKMCEIIARENNIPCDPENGFVDIVAMNYDDPYQPKDLASRCFSEKHRIPWVFPYDLVKTLIQNERVNLRLPTFIWGEPDITSNIVEVEICALESHWKLRKFDGVCFTGRPLLGLR